MMLARMASGSAGESIAHDFAPRLIRKRLLIRPFASRNGHSSPNECLVVMAQDDQMALQLKGPDLFGIGGNRLRTAARSGSLTPRCFANRAATGVSAAGANARPSRGRPMRGRTPGSTAG
jgi:hypothetical protein